MTLNAAENSVYSSQPNELYTFSRSAIQWRYTSADEDKVFNLLTYTAVTLKRAAMEQTQEMSRSNLTLNMDKNIPFLTQFRASPPTDIVMLTINRFNEGDTDLAVMWVGRVVSIKFTEREAEVRCEPVFTSMKRPTIRRMYQRNCPHVLYGTSCGANGANFAVAVDILSISGNTITASVFALKADGYYAGGYVDWEQGGALERRFITDHTGQVITLSLPFNGLTTDQTLRAYPGCDHTLNTCGQKFNNYANYGGQPYYPAVNPLTGTSIY